MAAEKDTQDRDRTAAAESLYQWWLGALPNLLGGLAPAAADASAQTAAGAPPAPFPVGQLGQGLALAQRWLGSLYEAYLRAAIAGRPGEEIRTVEQLVEDSVSGITDRLLGFGKAFSGHPNLAELNARLTGTPLTALGEALGPLSLNLERAYGGLADAFGLAPLRALEAAGRDMALAALAHRQAQVEYLEVVSGALHNGAEALMVRLAEMGRQGESVDSLLALVRLWARTTDQAMHDAMQSQRALDASAKLLRAAARARHEQQRVVAIASEALNVPTRAEVDEAFREIQQLKRELRRMRKAASASSAAAAAAALDTAAPETSPPPARTRATKTPAAGKTSRKGAAP